MSTSIVRISSQVLGMPTAALCEDAAVRPADYLEEIIVTAQQWEP